MQPVCQFLQSQGLSEQQIVEVMPFLYSHLLLLYYSNLLLLLPAAASSIQPCFNLVWLSFQVVTQHPPVLSYSIENRLQPFMAFLKEIGIADPAQTVLQRPTLLGLDADNSLRAIVGYLQENGHSSEEVAHLLQTTI